MLNKGDRTFGKDAEKLVESLGGLPLAFELARNFLGLRPNLSIQELLQEMEKRGEIETLSLFAEKYADELPTCHEKEVAATFQLSWEQASTTAKSILEFMSFLALAPVPRRLLRKILDLPSGDILDDPLNEAISELANRLSLYKQTWNLPFFEDFFYMWGNVCRNKDSFSGKK